jgi:hypothetical protein
VGVSPADIAAVGQAISALGLVGVFAVIIYTGAKRVWTWWSTVDDERKVAKERLDEMRQSRDDWKVLATSQAGTIANLTGQVEKLTGVVEAMVDGGDSRSQRSRARR